MLFEYVKDKKGLVFPAINWKFDIQEVFPDEKWMAFYRLGIFANRYVNEELHGMAYTIDGIHPVSLDGGFAQTSPLWLKTVESGDFPFTGAILLENAAVCHEVHFFAGAPDKYKNSLAKFYTTLPPGRGQLYNGLAVWFGVANILHLEPLLYFTLLNQPCEDVYENLGNYTLAQNTKKVLLRSDHLSDIKRPETDDQTRESFQRIAEILDLHNPLESIERYSTYLRKSIAGEHHPSTGEDGSWIADFVTCKAFDYFLKNPLEIVEWPRNIKKLVRNVPILNVSSEDSMNKCVAFISQKNIPADFMDFAVNWHLDYCHDLHMLFGLYRDSEVRCPHWIYERPSMCDLCKTCSGYLPNESLDATCPAFERYSGILDISSTKKEK